MSQKDDYVRAALMAHHVETERRLRMMAKFFPLKAMSLLVFNNRPLDQPMIVVDGTKF